MAAAMGPIGAVVNGPDRAHPTGDRPPPLMPMSPTSAINLPVRGRADVH